MPPALSAAHDEANNLLLLKSRRRAATSNAGAATPTCRRQDGSNQDFGRATRPCSGSATPPRPSGTIARAAGAGPSCASVTARPDAQRTRLVARRDRELAEG